MWGNSLRQISHNKIELASFNYYFTFFTIKGWKTIQNYPVSHVEFIFTKNHALKKHIRKFLHKVRSINKTIQPINAQKWTILSHQSLDKFVSSVRGSIVYYAPINGFPQSVGGGGILGIRPTKQHFPREFDKTLWHKNGTLNTLDWNSRGYYV